MDTRRLEEQPPIHAPRTYIIPSWALALAWKRKADREQQQKGSR